VDFTGFSALSFDCYGTLIDWETGILAVLRPWADAHGLGVDDGELLAAYSVQEPRAQEETPGALYPEIVARCMVRLGRELGAEVTEADAAALGTSVPAWPPFPDSHEALASLGRHYQLIILSNVDNASFAVTAGRLGVTFDRVLTAQDIGSYKPSKRNFGTLIAEAGRMGIPPGKLLHVAQSLYHDHVPAQQAGLSTVWINRRQARSGPGATRPPGTPVTPTWEFPTMAAFAAAAAPSTTPPSPSR
jgi:2-haloacid dehalogenase